MKIQKNRVVRTATASVACLTVGLGSMLVAVSPAAAAEDQGFIFTVNTNNEAEITGCVGGACATNLEIPVALTDNGTDYPVKTLRIGAFANKGLSSVEFEAGSQVEVIQNNAFANNTSLSGTVNFPASVKQIQGSAFLNTPLLSGVTFNGSNLTTIGNSAFNSASITSVRIPASVTSIGNSAFESNDLATLWFTENSQLVTIGNDAFKGNDLATVSIPSSVTSIGNGAFSTNDISNLTFDADSNLGSIGNSAFAENKLLQSVTIPSATASIGNYAFYDNQLTTLNFGDNSQLKSIGDSAFQGDNNDSQGNRIGNLSIPLSVETIGKNAFFGNRISTLFVPANVITIGEGSFHSNGMNDLSLQLAENLHTIGRGAFQNNNIQSVWIPPDVSVIGETAFAQNGALNDVRFYGDKPAFGDDVFQLTGGQPIYRKASASNWGGTDGINGRSVIGVVDPVITSQPAGGTLSAGGHVNLSVAADSTIPGQDSLSYQWFKGGVAIGGATSPTYAATSVGSYSVRVSSWAGTTPSVAASVVAPAPAPKPAPKPVVKKKQSAKVKLPSKLKRNKTYKLPTRTKQGVKITWKVKGVGKCKINKKKHTITCKRTTGKKKFMLVGTAKATGTYMTYKVTIKRKVR